MCDDVVIGHGTGACKRLAIFATEESSAMRRTCSSDLKALGYAKMHPLTAV